VADALQVFLAGQDVTEYVDRNETYEVMVRGEPAERRRPEDLGGVYVRGAGGSLVSLATLIELDATGTARERRRVDRLPSVTLSGTPAPGLDLGSVLDRLNEITEAELPPEARVNYLYLSKEYQESSAGVAVTFALALLIVDFANQRRAESGVGLREAVRDAVATRFRPILMTSIATFFGGVPLALASGAGAESRSVIGIVVVVGIVFATLVTLFVVPTLYLALGWFTARPGATDAKLARQRRQVEQGAE
jgi:multidrug efflux pump